MLALAFSREPKAAPEPSGGLGPEARSNLAWVIAHPCMKPLARELLILNHRKEVDGLELAAYSSDLQSHTGISVRVDIWNARSVMGKIPCMAGPRNLNLTTDMQLNLMEAQNERELFSICGHDRSVYDFDVGSHISEHLSDRACALEYNASLYESAYGFDDVCGDADVYVLHVSEEEIEFRDIYFECRDLRMLVVLGKKPSFYF